MPRGPHRASFRFAVPASDMTLTIPTILPAPTLTGVRHVGAARVESRHVPRLCGTCLGPMGRQEDACWRCGARVRRSRYSHGGGAYGGRRPTRQRRHSAALSRHVKRRRGAGAADSRRRASARLAAARRAVIALEAHDAPPSRAQDHARWQRERAADGRRARRLADELAGAIEVGDAGYRRLDRRLDDYGARLAVVRLRLYRTPASRSR